MEEGLSIFDVVDEIFGHLEVKEILNFGETCRLFHPFSIENTKVINEKKKVEYLKWSQSKSTVHIIHIHEYKFEDIKVIHYNKWTGIEPETHLTKGLKILHQRGSKIKKGDMVMFEHISGYRNDGVFIFDGEKITDLYFESDDYGSIHPEYKVIGEFPIRYWKDIVSHNYIVWFDQKPYLDQIRKNIRFEYNTLIKDEWCMYSSFIHKNDIEFFIIYEWLEVDDPKVIKEEEIKEKFLKDVSAETFFNYTGVYGNLNRKYRDLTLYLQPNSEHKARR